MDDGIFERIDAWQAAGLIDADTAEQLRSTERGRGTRPSTGRGSGPLGAVNAAFGPAMTIAEVFGYVGGAFLLAAWHVLISSGSGDLGQATGSGFIPAGVFAVLGFFWSRSGQARLGRAAGVAMALGTAHAAFGFALLLRPGPSAVTAVEIAALTLIVAAAFRRLHPAVLPQLTFVFALLGLSWTLFDWGRDLLFGARRFDAPPDTLLAQVFLTIGWWLAWAVVIGLLARWEWRLGDDAPIADDPAEEAAMRRGRVTRFVAGLTAVSGTLAGVYLSGPDGRALEPILGDGLVLVVSAALLAIATRFGTLAYLIPAAVGFITALTDLNAQYVVERTGTGMALIIEGVILIGTGVAAQALRRGMVRRDSAGPAAGGPPQASAGISPEPPAGSPPPVALDEPSESAAQT